MPGSSTPGVEITVVGKVLQRASETGASASANARASAVSVGKPGRGVTQDGVVWL